MMGVKRNLSEKKRSVEALKSRIKILERIEEEAKRSSELAKQQEAKLSARQLAKAKDLEELEKKKFELMVQEAKEH